MIKLFGRTLYVYYLVEGNSILAYSIHYSKEKSLEHLKEIVKYHNLTGEIIEDKELDRELEKILIGRIKFDKTPNIYLDIYKNREVYEAILRIPRGKVKSYSEIAKEAGKNTVSVIKAMKYNPFVILVPCHRVIRKDGKISGYTPLGPDFKRVLLKEEGYLK